MVSLEVLIYISLPIVEALKAELLVETLNWCAMAKKLELPPGPFSYPIIGNAHLFAASSRLVDFMEMARQYGNVFRLYIGSELTIIVNGREAIKEAFVTKAADFAGRRSSNTTAIYTHCGTACNVGTQDYGPLWKLLRSVYLSAQKLYTDDDPKHAALVNDEFDRLLQRIQTKNGQPHDIKSDILLSVVNMYCAMMFGSRYDLDDPEFARLAEAESSIFHTFVTGTLADVLPILKIFPFKSIMSHKGYCKDQDEIIGRIHREHVETNRVQNPRDLADALLKAKKEAEEEDPSNKGMVTDQHVTSLINDLHVASAVNTSNALSWALLYLIHYPSIQDMVHQELDQVVGPERLPHIKDKSRLPFLEATISETLRLATVIPLSIPHKTTVDTTLQGYHIPKDSTVLPNLWSLHHDPDIWDAPNDFRPQRFLDKEGKFVPPNPEHFVPFGIGIRDCFGGALAMVELYLILARLLHTFKFESPPGCDLPSLKPIEDVPFALEPQPFKLCAIKRHDKK